MREKEEEEEDKEEEEEENEVRGGNRRRARGGIGRGGAERNQLMNRGDNPSRGRKAEPRSKTVFVLSSTLNFIFAILRKPWFVFF